MVKKEILKKLMAEQVSLYKRTNVVQSQKFSEKIARLMNSYYNGLITNEEVIKELLKTAEEISNLYKNGQKLGLSQEELAFYDALTKPEHIKDFYQNEELIEMTKELAREKGYIVDEEGFNEAFKHHQEISKQSEKGEFKGGLADSSYQSTRLHTATHLLLAALRKKFGSDVHQCGSNITPERLRFDFNVDRKLTPEELLEIENEVNNNIQRAIDVEFYELPIDEAKQMGATGIFDDKYGDIVKVYKIGDVSIEMCGGPHVKNTSELNKFKIVKEESSSAGVRRIKAILE